MPDGYHAASGTTGGSATGAVEALSFHGYNITESDIISGLKNIKWPGRLEIIAKDPLVVLDGAKDIAAAEAASKAMSDFSYDNLWCGLNNQLNHCSFP